MAEFTKEVDSTVERWKWIPEESIKEINKFIYEKKEILKRTFDESENVPKHEDPGFSKVFVEQIKNEVSAEIKKLRRIPRPKEESKETGQEKS